MRKNIAVVGEKESVLGFKAVGFDVHYTAGPHETEQIIIRLASGGYAIIYVTEQALEPVIGIMDRYKDEKIPAIIPIPGKSGPIGIGLSGVKKSVERAVGADILFKE